MGDENVDVIPGSRRPDGTYRKPVRVKKGYVPPEEQEKFRTVDTTPAGVVGADADADTKPKAATASARKNEKRKEKKKLVESGDSTAANGNAEPVAASGEAAVVPEPAAAPVAAPSAEKSGEPSAVERKIKALQKKLRQIDELEEKKATGATLNAEQTAKVQGGAADTQKGLAHPTGSERSPCSPARPVRNGTVTGARLPRRLPRGKTSRRRWPSGSRSVRWTSARR